jgi:hypothetical protein
LDQTGEGDPGTHGQGGTAVFNIRTGLRELHERLPDTSIRDEEICPVSEDPMFHPLLVKERGHRVHVFVIEGKKQVICGATDAE